MGLYIDIFMIKRRKTYNFVEGARDYVLSLSGFRALFFTTLRGSTERLYSYFKQISEFLGSRQGRPLLFLLIGIIIFSIGFMFGFRFAPVKQVSSPSTTSTINMSSFPVAVTVDKSFMVSALEKDPKQIRSLTLTVSKAELSRELSLGDKTYDTFSDPRLKGKNFLIIYVEAENKEPAFASYPLVDSFRLTDYKGRPAAPDFTLKVVEVPAKSVKYEQVAFIVDEKQRSFTLLGGDISGEQTSISFSFPVK